jgi:hypothetical protein
VTVVKFHVALKLTDDDVETNVFYVALSTEGNHSATAQLDALMDVWVCH